MQHRDRSRDALLASAEFLLETERLNTPDTIFHVGILNGGTSTNIIAEEATAIATMRWFKDGAYQEMIKELEKISKDLQRKGRGTIEIKPYENICLPVQNSPHLVKEIRTLDGFIEPIKSRVSAGDDFSYFINKYSGAIISLGAKPKGENFPGHSNKFHIDENALGVGLELYVNIINRFKTHG